MKFSRKLLLALVCVFSASAFADVRFQEHKLQHQQPFNHAFDVNVVSIFKILNADGAVTVIPSTEDPLILDGTYRTAPSQTYRIHVSGVYRGAPDKPATLRFREVDPGKIRIETALPPAGQTSGSRAGEIRVGPGNSLSIVNGIRIRGTVSGSLSVINNRIYVNGKEITPGGDDGDTGERTVDLTVAIPEDVLLHLMAISEFGAVTVKDFASPTNAAQSRILYAESQNGSVSLENVVAPYGIIACSGFGDVCTKNTATPSGYADVRSGNGKIAVIQHWGGILAKSSFGAVSAKGVRGLGEGFGVEAHSDNGKVEVSDVEGTVLASSSFGSVTTEGVTGDVRAKSENGAVSVSGAADVVATSSFGKVRVSDARGRVRAQSNNGSVTLDNPEAIVEQASTDFGKVKGVRRPGHCELSLKPKIQKRSWNFDDFFKF